MTKLERLQMARWIDKTQPALKTHLDPGHVGAEIAD
jgi:hypothetical protein